MSENHNGDAIAGARRLRKTRFFQSRKARKHEPNLDDFPAFLASAKHRYGEIDHEPYVFEPSPRAQRDSFKAISETFATYKVEARKRLILIWQRARDLRLPRPRLPRREQFTRIVLACLLAPLPLLLMADRAPHPDEKAKPVATKSFVAEQPVFLLEDRLGFAQGLRDRLLSQAISSSMKKLADPATELRTLELPQHQVESSPSKEASFDVAAPPPPGTTYENTEEGKVWSLPFDSQPYAISDLPRTPEDSFRSEFMMSELIKSPSSVVQNDLPATRPPPRAHRKPAKPKKSLAQRRRPAQANPMTASTASPSVMAQKQQPNLPPPPILFFLGAPPQQGSTAP